MHNDLDKQREQDIRKEAVKHSRKIYEANLKSHNKNSYPSEETQEEEGREIEDLESYDGEDVIETADKIESYIKNGDKVYKD